MNWKISSCISALCVLFAIAAAPAAAGPDASMVCMCAQPWISPGAFMLQWGDEGGKSGGKDEGWGEEGGKEEGWGEEKGGEPKGSGEEGEKPGKTEEEGYLAGKMRKISISVFFNYSAILSGDAGSASNAPEYSEAFSGGIGGGLTFGLRLMPAVDIALSLGLAAFSAAAFDRVDPTDPAITLSHEFTTYMPITISAGFKVYFLFDRSVGDWFSFSKNKAQTGVAPYLGYMFGIGFHPAVDWVEPDTTKYPKCAYWDSGIILTQNFLFGIEWRFSASVGIMLEGQLATYGAPNPSDDATANGVNEAGYMMAFQIRIGLVLAF